MAWQHRPWVSWRDVCGFSASSNGPKPLLFIYTGRDFILFTPTQKIKDLKKVWLLLKTEESNLLSTAPFYISVILVQSSCLLGGRQEWRGALSLAFFSDLCIYRTPSCYSPHPLPGPVQFLLPWLSWLPTIQTVLFPRSPVPASAFPPFCSVWESSLLIHLSYQPALLDFLHTGIDNPWLSGKRP